MATNRNNIRVEPCNLTWNDIDLGYLDGNIEITAEEQGVDVTAHQEGTDVIDMIRTGQSVEVKVTLKETSTSQIKAMLAGAGGTTSAGVAEVSTVVCTADVSGSLNSKYFLVNTATDAIQYYVWLNVNSLGVDPAISGKTGVEVAVATSASANTIATAVAAALDALAGFVSTASTATVTITNAVVGSTTDIAAGNSGFTVAVTTQGMPTAITGYGASGRFTGQYAQAQRLVLHPTALASTDKTRNWTFWKAYPMLESFNPSGEEILMMPVTFKIFPDPSMPDAINKFAYGATI